RRTAPRWARRPRWSAAAGRGRRGTGRRSRRSGPVLSWGDSTRPGAGTMAARRATAPSPRPPMLRWFETRLDPFPADPPAQPPASLYAFCRHYTRGAEPWLLLMALSTGLIALAEVALYAYVGTLVDRMNALGMDDFLVLEGTRLAWM